MVKKEFILPKDTKKSIANLNRQKNQSNEKIRQAKRNYGANNRGACQAVGNIKDLQGDDLVEMLSQPTRKRKTRALINAQKKVHYTQKPNCSDWGMINPIKFNLSNDTINKLKKDSNIS